MSAQNKPETSHKTTEKKGKPRGAKSSSRRNYSRGGGGGGYKGAKSSTSSNINRNSSLGTSKSYKIVLRDLPCSNYTENQFKDCLDIFLESLMISRDKIEYLHFIEGKLSRKRGPLSGAGFICANDEATFLTICTALSTSSTDSPVLFLPEEDVDSQPQICIAPYQKTFRKKGRVDSFMGTIEKDDDFLQFQRGLQQPAEKLPSAEVQLEAKEKIAAVAQEAKEAFVKKETAKLRALAAKRDKGRGSSSRTERAIRLAVAANLANKESAIAIKKNPLLQYLKEKSEKKTVERKLMLREQAKRKQSGGGGKGSSTKDKDREDSSKQYGKSRNKEKDKEQGKAQGRSEKTNNVASDAPSSVTIASKPVRVLLKKKDVVETSSEKGGRNRLTNLKPSKSKAESKNNVPEGENSAQSELKDSIAKDSGKGKFQEKKKKGKKGAKTMVVNATGDMDVNSVNKEDNQKGDIKIKKSESFTDEGNMNKTKGKKAMPSGRKHVHDKSDQPNLLPQRTNETPNAVNVNSRVPKGKGSLQYGTALTSQFSNEYQPSHESSFNHENDGYYNLHHHFTGTSHIQFSDAVYQQQSQYPQNYFVPASPFQLDYSQQQQQLQQQQMAMNNAYLPPPPPFSPTYSSHPNPHAAPFHPKSSSNR